MANLFWKTRKGVKIMQERPFLTELEFERTVFNTKELLEDIFFLKRQVRDGGKIGIPDIIGVDENGRICIIEMKNKPVDISIVPQILPYAFWAETHPDAIKSLWLQNDERPENVTTPNWDALDVKILVVAPSILRATVGFVSKIKYHVDLIEIKRWGEGKNEILVVNKLEDDEPNQAKPKPVKGLIPYDAGFYKTERNPKSVDAFMKYAGEVEAVVKKKRWPLEMKFNKQYCGFRAGFPLVFGVEWIGTKTFAFFVKLPEQEAKRIHPKMTRYEHIWKKAVYFIEPGKTRTHAFVNLFEKAFSRRA